MSEMPRPLWPDVRQRMRDNGETVGEALAAVAQEREERSQREKMVEAILSVDVTNLPVFRVGTKALAGK